ncbi:hypothetical protein QNH88_27605, partial [Klebsiella pneumoniae]|nr:hypothetical protein [Klebsiella pneumoniae]
MFYDILIFLFNDPATSEIYTRKFVGSVRCIEETAIEDRGHVQLFIVSTTIFSSFFISGAGNTIAYCVRDGKKKGYVAILATLSLFLLIGLVVKFLLSNQTYQLLFFITQVVML